MANGNVQISPEMLAQLEAMLESGTPVRQLANARKMQPTGVRKSTTVVLEADETVAVNKPKAVKPTLQVPKSAEVTEYDGKTIVLRKIGKSGVDAKGVEWASDYIEFAGFKSINGDFKLNLRTARLLADENVQMALAALMAKIPQ